MKKRIICLGLIIVVTLIVGAMAAMAGTNEYTTNKATDRSVTSDDGATNKHNCGYYTGTWLPNDDATCWAEGSGTSGYSRSLYAKTTYGQGASYTNNCTGYSNNYYLYSETSGKDQDTGSCYSIVNGFGNKLTVTN